MKRALQAAMSAHWAMDEDALRVLLDVADRTNETPEAVAAKLGRPLENSHTVMMREGIAVIPVDGPLFRRANLFCEVSGATSYDVLAQDLNRALTDPTISGILFDIDSPGGEVTGADELAGMIFKARGRKPICAYIGGAGCSAAYWIASACDHIYADPTAMVGSIGIRSAIVDRSQRDADSGVQRRVVISSGAPKKALTETITDEGIAELQATLDAMESVFIATVARNRGVTPEKVRADYGQGGVLIAGGAADGRMSGLQAGLVDEISSFEAVLAAMQATALQMPGRKPGGAPSGTASQEKRMKDLTAALGLPEGSTEAEAVAAATALKRSHTELLGVIGRTVIAEAIAEVVGWKAEASKATALQAQVTALTGRVEAYEMKEREAAVDARLDALVTAGRILPVDRPEIRATALKNPEVLAALDKLKPSPLATTHREPITAPGATLPANIEAMSTEQQDVALKAAFDQLPDEERKMALGIATSPAAYMRQKLARTQGGKLRLGPAS